MIKIDFFNEQKQFLGAVRGGVYLIELFKDDENNSIPLYVGESGAVIKRCGEHLFKLFNNPEYLGLELKDLKSNDLTLKFSLAEQINEEKKFWWDKNYKEKELQVIQYVKPLTQLKTSDRQIKDKVNIVQDKMRELGFKLC